MKAVKIEKKNIYKNFGSKNRVMSAEQYRRKINQIL